MGVIDEFQQTLSNDIYKRRYFSSDQGGKTGVMPKHNAFMSRHSSSGRIFPTPSRRKRTSLWGQDLVLGALVNRVTPSPVGRPPSAVLTHTA